MVIQVVPTENVVKYEMKKMAKSLLKKKKKLLLSSVVNADKQNSCLFTNKGHFPSSSKYVLVGVLVGVLAKFHA